MSLEKLYPHLWIPQRSYLLPMPSTTIKTQSPSPTSNNTSFHAQPPIIPKSNQRLCIEETRLVIEWVIPFIKCNFQGVNLHLNHSDISSPNMKTHLVAPFTSTYASNCYSLPHQTLLYHDSVYRHRNIIKQLSSPTWVSSPQNALFWFLPEPKMVVF